MQTGVNRMYPTMMRGASHRSCNLSAYNTEAMEDNKDRVTRSPREAEKNSMIGDDSKGTMTSRLATLLESVNLLKKICEIQKKIHFYC